MNSLDGTKVRSDSTRVCATVRKHGGELILSLPNKKVYDPLQITRVHTLLEIHADEQAALRMFLGTA